MTKAKRWPLDGTPGSGVALLSSTSPGACYLPEGWASPFIHGSKVSSCKKLPYACWQVSSSSSVTFICVEVWKMEELLYLMTACAWHWTGCAESWLLQKLFQVPTFRVSEKIEGWALYLLLCSGGQWKQLTRAPGHGSSFPEAWKSVHMPTRLNEKGVWELSQVRNCGQALV